jgi:putative endopeptidase
MSSRSRVVLLSLVTLLVGWSLGGPALARQSDVHGIDVANMDLAVSPEVDFYRFANGGWLDRVDIPGDRGFVAVRTEINDRAIAQQLELLHAAAAPEGAPSGSDEAKAGAVFAQGLDMAARDRAGIAPIQDALDRIAAIDSSAAYHAYLARAPFDGVGVTLRQPFDGIGGTLPVKVMADAKDSTTYALYVVLDYPTVGLPNRDYYLADDPALASVRQAYRDTSAALLTAAGYPAGDAIAAAGAVYDFEQRLMAATLTREQKQDYGLQYNPMTLDELAAAYPAIDWPTYLTALGISGVDRVIAGDTGYLAALPAIMAETPVETLRAYLTLRLMMAWADALSGELGATAFALTRALSGLETPPPLEERVLERVNGAVPDVVGKLYVAAYFPPEAKATMEALTQDVLTAFRRRLEANPWMTPATRAEALRKLAAVTVKVGYPDRWETYEAVALADSFAGSLRSALAMRLAEHVAKAGQPVDRGQWTRPVQDVDAFYVPSENAMFFSASILQPPFFDYEADSASNLGGIGFIAGHEITHGFDLGGSQFDGEGNLRDWWTAEDRQRFLAQNEALAAQFSAIEVAPGLFVNGQFTVIENSADLGGLQNAYAALIAGLDEDETALAASPTSGATPAAVTVAPPFTPEQRFFIAAAAIWRIKIRPEALELFVRNDTHSPDVVRGTQPLRNADPFYAAFGIEPGDPMWLAPEERIVIW